MSASSRANLEIQEAMGGEREHRQAEQLDAEYWYEKYLAEQIYLNSEKEANQEKFQKVLRAEVQWKINLAEKILEASSVSGNTIEMFDEVEQNCGTVWIGGKELRLYISIGECEGKEEEK